jgi:ferritin-like metal-binding protein YciE
LLDCSDAHYNSSEKQQKDKIGKCFTWIKSDPTFNGLKQIKYEPETRILIQDERPQEKTSYNVIDKVKFVGSSDSTYFNSNAIELNPNLNVIIGGKSSGKSLLLFHIAKAIDPIQVKEKLSVVNEKEYDLFSKVPEFDFKVRWEDGAINKLTDPDETKNRHITYIPQMYINHLAEQKGEKKLAELIENILSQNSNFKKFNEVQGKRIQDLNLKIGNDINELFSTRARAEAMIKEYRGIGDKKAIEDNINKIRKEITALNQKAGFSPDEVKLFTKLQKKKERVNSKKNKVDEYKERTNEYVQELVNLKNEVAERIEILPSQWFEITDALAQNFIDANIAQDIKESNEMFSHLIDKHSKLIQNFTKAIATKTFTLEQVNKALNPFNAKISNQQLLKRLETELIEDENKIKRLDEKDKQLIQIKEEGMKLKNDILKSIENLFDYYKQILEQIQSPELSVIGTGLYLQTDLEIDKNAFQNGFCGLLDGRSNFNTLFGNCFDMSNNYVYSKESHVENIKSIF